MKNKLIFILLLSLTNLFSFNDVDSVFNQSKNGIKSIDINT